MICRIDRVLTPKGFVVLHVSGRLHGSHVEALRDLTEVEKTTKRGVAIDLTEVTLVSHEAVKVLTLAEASGIEIRHCPAYVREWISRAKENYDRPGMQPNILRNSEPKPTWLVTHPLSQEDSVAVTTLRSDVAKMKGRLEGTSARGAFDEIMTRVPLAPDVTFEAGTVGGIPGWWAKLSNPVKGAAIMHLHGGWFNWGSAQVFRNFVGHIALNAGVDSFIADYRLSPEHQFPAAVKDVEACYRGIVDMGIARIALTGDSAGGNLALGLLSIASAQAAQIGVAPVGAVVFSPITDLALTANSFATRAEADPYFTRSQVSQLVRSYLGETDPRNPLASPLYADLSRLPPIRVHVGDDEILLDDSLRYVERAVTTRVDASLDVWMGMPHGFVTAIGKLNAATQALRATGEFLTERLGNTI